MMNTDIYTGDNKTTAILTQHINAYGNKVRESQLSSWGGSQLYAKNIVSNLADGDTDIILFLGIDDNGKTTGMGGSIAINKGFTVMSFGYEGNDDTHRAEIFEMENHLTHAYIRLQALTEGREQ